MDLERCEITTASSTLSKTSFDVSGAQTLVYWPRGLLYQGGELLAKRTSHSLFPFSSMFLGDGLPAKRGPSPLRLTRRIVAIPRATSRCWGVARSLVRLSILEYVSRRVSPNFFFRVTSLVRDFGLLWSLRRCGCSRRLPLIVRGLCWPVIETEGLARSSSSGMRASFI